MIPTPFDYARAASIDDAIAKLQAGGGSAKLVAGGHSLVPLMKLRLSEPDLLIDIARLPGLSGIREKGAALEIGAATVHHDVATSPLLRSACPVVAECAAEIGDPQVRNRGTLGGSLAHADPAADYPAVMLALDASIQIQGPGGARAVQAGDFFRDLFTVDLKPDEIITGVQFTPTVSAAYAKLHQRASHFAIVGVAAAIQVKDGVIQSARIGLTGATSHAIRLTDVEAAVTGKPASDATVEAAAKLGTKVKDVSADIHASQEYRRAMIAIFTERALKEAIKRA